MIRACVAVLLAGALVATLAGCGAQPEAEPGPELHGALAAVSGALETRAGRATDAGAYEPYFADPEVARQLAESAAAEGETTASPTPRWEPPYVSEETSVGASVVVVWDVTDEWEGWPPATLFELQDDGGEWRIVDALDLTEDELLQTLR